MPQGNKSRVEPTADGKGVRKVYNDNGDPQQKYAREVGFYARYGASPLIPDLLAQEPAEPAIVMTRAPGAPCSTLNLLPGERRRLSQDYAEKVVALFSVAGDMTAIKASYCHGRGAAEFRDGVLSVLNAHPAHSPLAERILAQLKEAVGGIPIADELLIKLDWNASNVFVQDGAITQFIDFEQAFVGTREMLAGILLHNPFWCARAVFSVLRQRGLFAGLVDAVEPWIAFALASVVADSVGRTGKPWSAERLALAYQRHVVDRVAELANRS